MLIIMPLLHALADPACYSRGYVHMMASPHSRMCLMSGRHCLHQVHTWNVGRSTWLAAGTLHPAPCPPYTLHPAPCPPVDPPYIL